MSQSFSVTSLGSPQRLGTPPPPYTRRAPMVVIAGLGDGRVAQQADAWERPPQKKSCWREMREEICEADADEARFTLSSWCCNCLAYLLCAMCGD